MVKYIMVKWKFICTRGYCPGNERKSMRKYIEIGKIVNTHGISGTVRTEPWCDSPLVLAGMKKIYFSPKKSGEEFRETKILKASVQKNRVLLTLEGIDSVEKAECLKNTVIYADRNDIPLEEGAHLIDDLKGLPLIDENTGRVYGKLHDVIKGGASDLYEVSTEKGMVLMPAVKEFVKRIELENAIYIAPIRGMFDED